MFLRILACLLMVLPAAAASAQTYPSKPVRLIVTFAPGGGADFVARAIAPGLSEALGQPVVVDNKAGANGVVGADAAAKAAPDGYTLLLGTAGTLAVAPHLGEPLPFDPLRDLIPVSLVATSAFAITVNKAVPVDTLAALVAYAKAHPDKLNYGSSGTGGAPHLAAELFCSMAGVQMTHVPYRGLAPAIADLISGQIQVLFADVSLVASHVKSGALRGLAVTGANRSTVLPDLPPVAEAGVPGYSAGTWYGIFLPAGTPAVIVTRVAEALKKVMASPELKATLAAQGVDAAWDTPEQFATFVREDSDKWRALIRKADIKAPK
jgi:tripartite-type tricarboxylate transporter receptor subunit TctC